MRMMRWRGGGAISLSLTNSYTIQRFSIFIVSKHVIFMYMYVHLPAPILVKGGNALYLSAH